MTFQHLQEAAPFMPPASVFEKIQKLDPAGPIWILDEAEKISEERRRAQTEEVSKPVPLSRSLMRGISDIFSAMGSLWSAPSYKMPAAQWQSPEHDWALVGNDIRTATRRYLWQHPKVSDKIALTVEEHNALAPVSERDVRTTFGMMP